MKNTFLFLTLTLGIALQSFAQNAPIESETYDRNIVKVNLTGLLLRNYGLQYERMLTRKTSIALGIRTQPKGTLPGLSFLENTIDDPETFQELEKISMSNVALTPEIRFYIGKKVGPRGFYIAPYLRYSQSEISVPDFEYTVSETVNGQTFEETRTIDLNGDIKGITGGVMFGAQWKLGGSLYLDWWIIGGSFGSSSGLISANTPLTSEEQQGVREELNNIDIPLLDYTIDVDSNGAKMDFNGPFASLRGGLSLGIKF